MNSSKKPLSILLSLLMAASLSGCMQADTAPDSETGAAEPQASQQPVSQKEQPLSPEEPAEIVSLSVASNVRKTISEHTPALTGRALAKKQINPDTVGWLYIPDTTVNTQIVQSDYDLGHSYYLQHDFNNVPSVNGTYCADRRCEFGSGRRSELSQFTTLYAHSWDDDPDGELFSQLKKFKDPEFAKSHPYLYFSTTGEDMAWQVFAVFDTTVDLPYVWPELPSESFRQVMDVISSSSIYNYGIRVSESDKILTLSTCTFTVDGRSLPLNQTNDYRFVVMAKLVSPGAAYLEEASFTVNASPLSPDSIPEISLPWL